MKIQTATLAGTATLAALVVVLDYSLKYSNLKIPFPPLPFLKFDFTGIPIVLSLLFFGLIPGAFTSIVALVSILARSGDIVGSSTKGLAEFSTILGMALSARLFRKLRVINSFALGVTSRVLVMTCTSLALIYAGVVPFPASYVDIPLTMTLLLVAFNAVQGTISIVGGCSIHEAIKKRAPFLIRGSKE
jgi:riboflavin transporter FmnP